MSISAAAIADLRAAVRGTVYHRDDPGFVRHSQLFNSVIRSPAKVLVRPLDAQDISAIVRFCARHGLTPSVKSGGYGTHGWAVEGDVVVDMRLLAQITIERPLATTPDWATMSDSPHVPVADPDSVKGKSRATAVGLPPIHSPFTEPQRRTAEEAFDVIVVPPEVYPDEESDTEHPSRKLRVSSPGSAHPSVSSTELTTPPTTASPRTPSDSNEPKPGAPNNKSLGPATAADVVQDESMLPPTADRPIVGFDVRGFVGRDPGSWEALWARQADAFAAASAPTLSPAPVPPLRSTAPASARPFDFDEPTTCEVNVLANPHGNPGGSLFQVRSPFQFMGLDPDSSPAATSTSTPNPPTSSPSIPAIEAPQAPTQAETSAPTVTHVAFEPTAPVPHTYVTFGAGASQKDIDGFCAAHPLGAITPGYNLDNPFEKPTVVADTARPELYQPPIGASLGPLAGSFFAPGRPGASPTIPYYVPFAAHPVGSSVMLLGGFGFMSRLRGLSMDCLVEAEVVLADGRIVWVSEAGVKDEHGNDVELDLDESDALAEEFLEGEREIARRAKEKAKAKEDDASASTTDTSADEKPDEEAASEDKEQEEKKKRGLWWALRGAGSAFGIVVRYKARAFPVPVVFAGNLIYNFNKLTAPSLIKHFRDCIKAAPRELYANCILTAGPKNKGALVVIQICYAGTRAQGLPFLQAISSWEGEGCLLNEVQEKEFVWQQDSVAKVLKGGSGRKWFIRSDLIGSLTDDIIHGTVRQFSDTPDGCTWLFELSGGALADTTNSCLPKSAREAAFTIVALHQWKLEMNDPACVLTAEQWIRGTLGPHSIGGPFPAFLERREKRSRIIGTYGAENWARLCALKRKYDPNGMFKHNFWPLDDDGKPVVDPREMRSGADKTSGHVMDMTLDDRGVPIVI